RGAGRALDVRSAHRGLLSGAGSGAGPYSLWARIERLRTTAPVDRPAALEELRRLTGADPVAAAPVDRLGADPDSAAVALWTEWWNAGRAPLDPDDGGSLTAAGVDPWSFSLEGRALRYVGSRECLGCHETRHREHSRRWLATKFRSLERLTDEPDPGACLECHATGWDPATGAYVEPGVTCEGCHGPGERYNAMMVTGQELLAAGDDARANELLDRASRMARDAVSRRSLEGDSGEMNVCVRCHHPRRHRDRGPGELEREPGALRAAVTEGTR
ncbi:MAG TPA: multiheme c-type cytochrome, partial [bacterium]|nr:multiheme c-type cytochrome [bacterium]